jgi:hypothetical protein
MALACMRQAALACSPATLSITRDGQVAVNRVQGKEGTNCVLTSGSFGAGMGNTCRVPLSVITDMYEQAQLHGEGDALALGLSVTVSFGNYTNPTGQQVTFNCTGL